MWQTKIQTLRWPLFSEIKIKRTFRDHYNFFVFNFHLTNNTTLGHHTCHINWNSTKSSLHSRWQIVGSVTLHFRILRFICNNNSSIVTCLHQCSIWFWIDDSLSVTVKLFRHDEVTHSMTSWVYQITKSKNFQGRFQLNSRSHEDPLFWSTFEGLKSQNYAKYNSRTIRNKWPPWDSHRSMDSPLSSSSLSTSRSHQTRGSAAECWDTNGDTSYISASDFTKWWSSAPQRWHFTRRLYSL